MKDKNKLFEFFGVQSQEELLKYMEEHPEEERVQQLKEVIKDWTKYNAE